MGIGGSILLLALGAIFAFAVDFELGWLDINTVGWVLMIAGLVGLVMTTYFWQSRRRAVAPTQTRETVVTEDPYAAPAPVRDDHVSHEYREVRRRGV